MSEFVTRQEHLEAVRRLDEADSELSKSILETERELRRDYEQKIAAAVIKVGQDVIDARELLKENIGDTRENLSQGLGRVESHLTWQDRLITGTFVSTMALFFMYILLHYGFGIG